MDQLEIWSERNKMQTNAKKPKDMWICFKKSRPAPDPVYIAGTELHERVTDFKRLGVHMQSDLKWNIHVSRIIRRANKRMYHVKAC